MAEHETLVGENFVLNKHFAVFSDPVDRETEYDYNEDEAQAFGHNILFCSICPKAR